MMLPAFMTRRARTRAIVVFLVIATTVPLAVLLWYDTPAAGPFDLYPRLAAAYRAIGLDIDQIQRNQLNHLIRACLVEPQLWLTLIYAASPAIAAAAAWRVGAGRGGAADFVSRYLFWRRISFRRFLRAYAITLLASLAYIAAMRGLASLLGAGWRWPALGPGYVASNLAIGLILNQGGLLEEGGWRGFLQPVLGGSLRSPLRAALLVGCVWALWHVPRDVLRGTPFAHPAEYAFGFTSFWVGCVGDSIILAWLLALGEGTLWPCIAFHGAHNYAEWLVGASATHALTPWAGALVDTMPAIMGGLLVVWLWHPERRGAPGEALAVA